MHHYMHAKMKLFSARAYMISDWVGYSKIGLSGTRKSGFRVPTLNHSGKWVEYKLNKVSPQFFKVKFDDLFGLQHHIWRAPHLKIFNKIKGNLVQRMSRTRIYGTPTDYITSVNTWLLCRYILTLLLVLYLCPEYDRKNWWNHVSQKIFCKKVQFDVTAHCVCLKG